MSDKNCGFRSNNDQMHGNDYDSVSVMNICVMGLCLSDNKLHMLWPYKVWACNGHGFFPNGKGQVISMRSCGIHGYNYNRRY